MTERSKIHAEEDWRNDPLENTPPVRGSGEFLKDRGYPNPTETRIKFDLVSVLRELVEAKSLTQTDIVERVSSFDPSAGVSQPDISRILRGNVKGYSEARLLTILAALGNNVSIVVEPSVGQGKISVRESFKKARATYTKGLHKRTRKVSKPAVMPKRKAS